MVGKGKRKIEAIGYMRTSSATNEQGQRGAAAGGSLEAPPLPRSETLCFFSKRAFRRASPPSGGRNIKILSRLQAVFA
jgi:hypothetical protein